MTTLERYRIQPIGIRFIIQSCTNTAIFSRYFGSVGMGLLWLARRWLVNSKWWPFQFHIDLSLHTLWVYFKFYEYTLRTWIYRNVSVIRDISLCFNIKKITMSVLFRLGLICNCYCFISLVIASASCIFHHFISVTFSLVLILHRFFSYYRKFLKFGLERFETRKSFIIIFSIGNVLSFRLGLYFQR